AITRLQTFNTLAELYEVLAFQHYRRRSVAIAWLQANNLPNEIPASMAPVPEPNSPAWLDAMENWNPLNAEITREIVRLAGRADVCSVCGDEECQDYRLLEPDASPCPVKTMRLCSDCARIREDEGWIPRGAHR